MRRAHVEEVHPGRIQLGERESHHLARVLRLGVGEAVELFDDAGTLAAGVIAAIGPRIIVEVSSVTMAQPSAQLTIASAIPKGERADWMIEKLSELGVQHFIPLRTARSVVHPEGLSKHQRWQRIAAEAARQSQRAGVMRIDPLTALDHLLSQPGPKLWFDLSAADAGATIAPPIVLLIGPEGGWSDEEREKFRALNLPCARLTSTILRTETAAIVAAALVQARLG